MDGDAAAALRALRNALVRLHAALTESERLVYEREHGRLSAGELLQRVINDDFFAWLRPLSELIVRADETLAGDEPPGAAELAMVRDAARTLLAPRDPGLGFAPPGFGTRYHDAIQRDPAVVLAHADTARLLATR